MSEQPVGEQSAPDRDLPYPVVQPYVWHPPVPRVVIKADLLPAVSILSTVALVGLGVGWLWSRLAPPQRKYVLPEVGPVPLTDESYHRFDALVVFMLLCLGAGLVVGVAVWFLRERRGPVVLLAAAGGGALGAWLAMSVGTAWADGRWPAPASVRVSDIVSVPPSLESPWGIIAWPLMTALAYGVLAALNGMDDLGRRLA